MAVPTKVPWFNPGSKVYWRGRWWDAAMVVALKDVERVAGADYFYQGSFNKGVGKSAGTHDAGGTGDCKSRGLKVRQIRAQRGIASLPRTRDQGFVEHDHFILIGARTASKALKAQMIAWCTYGRNALANNGKDDSGVRGQFNTYVKWRAEVKAAALKRAADKKAADTKAATKAEQDADKASIDPVCSIKGVNNSIKYGVKVRPYNSVKLIQKALNKLYKNNVLKVDGIAGPATLGLFNRFRRAKFGNKKYGGAGTNSLRLLFKLAGMNVKVVA